MATPTNLPATAVSGEILTAAYVNNLRGAFRVLQVVAGSTSTSTVSSLTSFTDTGLTATITPQFTTSKILVLVNHADCFKSASFSTNAITLKLLRGATDIQRIATNNGYTNTTVENTFNVSGYCLDSPATTSATTYKTQYANLTATSQVGCQIGSNSVSTIILCEISA